MPMPQSIIGDDVTGSNDPSDSGASVTRRSEDMAKLNQTLQILEMQHQISTLEKPPSSSLDQRPSLFYNLDVEHRSNVKESGWL